MPGAAGQGPFLPEDRKADAGRWGDAARNQAPGHRVRDLDTVALDPVVLGHVGEGLTVGERLEQAGDEDRAGDGREADRKHSEAAEGNAAADYGDRHEEGQTGAELEPGKRLRRWKSVGRSGCGGTIRGTGGAFVPAERAWGGGCFREEPGLAVRAELGSGDAYLRR